MSEVPYSGGAHQKPIYWVASSYKDLVSMPEEIQDAVGYALDLAQHGSQAHNARAMKGPLRDVVEIRVDDDRGSSTFRATYTVTLDNAVYVLDVFRKKSKTGIATPQVDLNRIEGRLQQAKEHDEKQQREAKNG
jgi:phage-related protein